MKITKGSYWTFEYKSVNYKGARFQWEKRRVYVLEVRDVGKNPLLPATIAQNPNLLRSGYLIIAIDLDKLEVRRFYTGSMRNLEECPQYPIFSAVWVQDGPDGPNLQAISAERVRRLEAEVITDAWDSFVRKMEYAGIEVDHSIRMSVIDFEIPYASSTP